MFGYIKVDKTALENGEFGLYHAFFCNLCMSSKRQFGFSSRLLTNFDMAVFNVLFHSFTGESVELEQSHCVTTPIKKRSIIKPTGLGDRVSQANVILCYLNLIDDVRDERNLRKRIALAAIRRPYKKAKRLFLELDSELSSCYEELYRLEKEGCRVFDEVCHPFAKLSAAFCQTVLGEQADGYIVDLCYNLGKWVYLIDALDDLEKDFRRKNYNPFINCWGNYVNAGQFVRDNYADLRFVFYSVLNKIAENYNDLNLGRYVCILKNVLHKSIRDKTAQVFAKYEIEPK